MIQDGQAISFDLFRELAFDLFIYGVGYETRSIKLASVVRPGIPIFGLKMPEVKVHKYLDNVEFANGHGHSTTPNFNHFIKVSLPEILKELRSNGVGRRSGRTLKIGFDVSSVNRVMIFGLLRALAQNVGQGDEVSVFYCPAKFSEPDRRFPQIARLGPVHGIFSSFDSDPTKPLCLVLGLGFEAGVSMGIISQLEPQVSYCLWGGGVDKRFDEAVQRANFGFQFTGFYTKVSRYAVLEPLGSFSFLESMTYGLLRQHRVIIIPMGPKLFAVYAVLLGMKYLGHLAVWRVQHSGKAPVDAEPGGVCVRAVLDTELLRSFARKEAAIFAGSGDMTALAGLGQPSP